MILRFEEVIPKKLFRGSAPSPNDVLLLKNKFKINKIISLDRDSGEKINRVCKMLNIKHIKMYIDMDRKSLLHFLQQDFKKLFLNEGPTFVHCLHGKDRTGLACAIIECQFLGKSPEKAIEHAKSLGFGIGVDPEVVNLYEKIIKSCKPNKDENDADIVSNEREYKGDNRDSFLEEAQRGSFAPYLDHTKQAPADALYNYINDQSQTRENYNQPIKKHEDDDVIPQVGVFNNDAGIQGFGPTINMTGFIYE